MKKDKSNGGFTLIELLVVLSIIGVLAAIIMASLNTARANSRDMVRKQELVQLRNALEVYRTTHNSYPSTGGVWYASIPGGETASNPVLSDNGGDWIPGLVQSKAIAKLPQDPIGGISTIPDCAVDGWHKTFLYQSNGTDYKIVSHCAPEGTWTTKDQFYDPAPRAYWAWMITSNPAKQPGNNGTDCNPQFDVNYPACW
ncbi:MAG: type II secretion system protein [bacterium]